jgi:hypothetical protein
MTDAVSRGYRNAAGNIKNTMVATSVKRPAANA